MPILTVHSPWRPPEREHVRYRIFLRMGRGDPAFSLFKFGAGREGQVARLAIFMDGGYVDAVSRDEFAIWPDYAKLSGAIADAVRAATPEPVDVLRTLYYHCLPYQSNPPTPEEAARYSQSRSFFAALKRLPRFEVREGRLAYRGDDAKGKPIFQQKRVDLLLGLDFALYAGKRQITHAAVVSGDSDLIPAVMVAKEEGVCVWLFHGPRHSRKDGTSTYALELWEAADERLELDAAFMKAIARTR